MIILTSFPFQAGERRRDLSALLAWQGVSGLLFVIPVLGDLHVVISDAWLRRKDHCED